MDRFAADNGYFDFNFVGRDIFKRAVKGMGGAAQTVLNRAGLDTKDIDLLIPHQANIRIIQTLADLAGIGQEKAFVNIQNYGNTSAATVPIAMCEALEQGRVKPGDNILVAAFGAGLTWGSGLIKWGQRISPVSTSDAALSDNSKTALELIDSHRERCFNKPE
jgi:3-oxoacyl-[acyl-carrier-protein] synthase-3